LPEDGERIALAQNTGTVTLALRNPLDVDPTDTQGVKMQNLMRGKNPEPVIEKNRVIRKIVPLPAAPPPAKEYTVETIRAAKRGSEVVK